MNKKAKNLLSWIFSPFSYFKYKKFYTLLAYDLIFLLGLLWLGTLSGNLSDKASIGQGALLFLVILGMIILLYSGIKYLFYKKIKQKKKFWSILWKHSLGYVLLFIIIYIAVTIVIQIIKVLFLTQVSVLSQQFIGIVSAFLGYVAFISFQAYDKKGLFVGLWKGIKSTFSSRLGHIVYADAVILIIGYIVVNIVNLVMRLLLVEWSAKMFIFQKYSEIAGTIVMALTIVAMMAVNKMIVNDVKPKALK